MELPKQVTCTFWWGHRWVSTAGPKGHTCSQRQRADRYLHSGTRIFQGTPPTCSTPDAFHAALEQCWGLFPCSLLPPTPLFTYHCWAKKQKQERKQSHNAGKKREPTNEQAEAVIIRMVQQVHFWEPNRYFNANVQQRMAFSPRLHRPKGTVDDYGY